MTQKRRALIALIAMSPMSISLGLLSSGCLGTDSPAETRYYFGDVYDGVTGKQVTDYHVAVEYFGRRYEGQIDARGGFALPAIPADQDFSVYIDAPGFRTFTSHQAQFADAVHADRSFHYEAYLFATSLEVGDVAVNLTLSDSPQLPSGSIRLRPTDLSAVYNDPTERPGGIAGQVWTNSNDLLAETVWVDFQDGVATLPGKDLVYGVPYQVTILNVPGYQLDTPPAFQAGIDGHRAYVLTRLSRAPLTVSYVSTKAGNPTPDGSLTIVFNQAAELDPLYSTNAYRESIDDAFSIDSDNTNQNATYNTLNDNVDPNLQERGTNFQLDGQRLVFTWDKTRGLHTYDPGDNIQSVTYGALDGIRLRPAGGNESDVVVLSDLLGSKSATVVVSP